MMLVSMSLTHYNIQILVKPTQSILLTLPGVLRAVTLMNRMLVLSTFAGSIFACKDICYGVIDTFTSS